MAKKGQIFRKRSSEFKLSVIMDMRENHLGLRETERKNTTARCLSFMLVLRWLRIKA